jgi:hypothetical protein
MKMPDKPIRDQILQAIYQRMKDHPDEREHWDRVARDVSALNRSQESTQASHRGR